MKQQTRSYWYLTLLTFGVLWAYVFLRAIFVSPIHDEVATYFHFIEPGNIWGKDVIMDANNHLLNSLLGRISYRLFGESFFLFRLPNVLCFALYFWGIRRLLKELDPLKRYLALVGITSIPWILEYFAYTRGYGMSASFFIWVLVFAQKTIKNYKLLSIAGLYFFAFLAILSNLSFMTTGCLAVALVIVWFFLHFRKLSYWQMGGVLLLTIGFLAACKPLYELSMQLKEVGSLYYGSLDGLWDVTGKTLSRYVLFFDHDALCWVLLAAILILLGFQLKKLFGEGLKNYLSHPETAFSWFFFGMLALIIFLAEVMQINYPEDRVGIQLVPLFLVLLVSTFAKSKAGKYVVFALLYFPITLLAHLSFSTSVFSPDERITDDFYQAVKKHLTPASTLSGYPTMELTWALHERKAAFKNYLHQEKAFHPTADVVLVKTALLEKNTSLKGYKIIAEDKEAGFIAYQRLKEPRRKPLAMIMLSQLVSRNEFLEIARFDVQDDWKDKPLHISVKGTLFHEYPTEIESLVLSSTKKDGSAFRYESFDLRRSHGILQQKIPFEMHYEFDRLDPDENNFVVYLWNKYLHAMALENCTVMIYSLEDE